MHKKGHKTVGPSDRRVESCRFFEIVDMCEPEQCHDEFACSNYVDVEGGMTSGNTVSVYLEQSNRVAEAWGREAAHQAAVQRLAGAPRL